MKLFSTKTTVSMTILATIDKSAILVLIFFFDFRGS